jgi:hypothetical protein
MQTHQQVSKLGRLSRKGSRPNFFKLDLSAQAGQGRRTWPRLQRRVKFGAPMNPDDQSSVHDFLQSRRGQLTLYIAAIIMFVVFIFTYFP